MTYSVDQMTWCFVKSGPCHWHLAYLCVAPPDLGWFKWVHLGARNVHGMQGWEFSIEELNVRKHFQYGVLGMKCSKLKVWRLHTVLALCIFGFLGNCFVCIYRGMVGAALGVGWRWHGPDFTRLCDEIDVYIDCYFVLEQIKIFIIKKNWLHF